MPSFPSGWSPTTCDHTAPRSETLGSSAGVSAGDGVESTTGAVAVGPEEWLFAGSFRTLPVPQFEPWLRFQSPLVSRVGDWRAGLGRSLYSLLARSFVCECHTISAVPRFQPPPRRTQHADFPHCALLFASPQELWDLSCRSGFRRWSNHSVAIEQLQSLIQPSPTPPRPAEALSVPGSQHIAPDLLLRPVFHEAEALAGVSHRKVVHPTAQHRVDQLHDPVNRLRLVAAENILELAKQRRPLFELGRVVGAP